MGYVQGIHPEQNNHGNQVQVPVIYPNEPSIGYVQGIHPEQNRLSYIEQPIAAHRCWVNDMQAAPIVHMERQIFSVSSASGNPISGNWTESPLYEPRAFCQQFHQAAMGPWVIYRRQNNSDGSNS